MAVKAIIMLRVMILPLLMMKLPTVIIVNVDYSNSLTLMNQADHYCKYV